ncbi:MAG: hypothetical protein R3E48_20045 [Burkholderiaceae bacterium]
MAIPERAAGTNRAIGGTNFSSSSGSGNILSATTNISSLSQGLNLGVVRGTVTLPGVGEVLNLGLLARALEGTGKANVLATPNLMTLDNEEARIIIGQNVPFVTGQFTNTGAAQGSVNPFQTIERKDVGTTLRVKPQISESGTVKLQIFQEVSNVQTSTVAADLITNKRSIESNVLVDDGQIIVLGGLIEERTSGGSSKVPGLGDIPFLGNLFRYDERSRTKTNLLVFLRPVIMRDANAAHRVTADRYDYIRQLRGDSGMAEHWLLPSLPNTPMPAMVPPPGQAAPKAGSLFAPNAATPALDVRVPAPTQRGAPAPVSAPTPPVTAPARRPADVTEPEPIIN